MSDSTVAKAGTREQARRSIKIGFALWGVATIILGAGIYWLGMPAMFELNSPEFMPIASFFAAALALFGTIHIGQGLVRSARFGKYGASTLEAGPAVLGQAYRGQIRTDRALEVTGPFTIRLLCETQALADSDGDTNSNKGRAAVWETSVSAPASTRSSVGIPFKFRIPADGLPNLRGSSVPGHAIYWSLSVSAPMAGLHYQAAFSIDVGATETESDDDDGPVVGPKSLASAFAGQAKPEFPAFRIARFVAPIAGAVLFIAGAYGTANQWSHSRNGIALAGKIASVNRPVVEVAIDGGSVVRVAGVTKNHIWHIGQPVQVTCLRDGGQLRSCRMDTGRDRWIDGLGTLAVGAAMLLFGGWLWYRRRGQPTPRRLLA